MNASILPALLIATASLTSALAQPVPQGAPFQINTGTERLCFYPDVAMTPSGSFVVTWQHRDRDGSGWGIFARRYDTSGLPLGPDFQVNAITTNDQQNPRVATNSSGEFLVVWDTFSAPPASSDVFGRRFDASGTPLGPEFQLNSFTTNHQSVGRAVMDEDGGFVVIWSSYLQDGSQWGVFGRRFDPSGTPLGPEFQVNSYTAGSQGGSSIALDPAGGFIVVWDSVGQDGSQGGVIGRRFDASGTPRGGEFIVNDTTSNDQTRAVVAQNPAGGFLVVWNSMSQDGSGWGVFGRRISSLGIPSGAEFQVNAYTWDHQYGGSIALDAAGDFVVAWGRREYAPGWEVEGRRFDPSGDPFEGEFDVNVETWYDEQRPSIASDAAGGFVVAYEGYEVNFARGIFGRRYDPPCAGPVSDLRLTHDRAAGSTLLTWTAPPAGGDPSTLLYDVLRTGSPLDFAAGAACVASDIGPGTTATDVVDPPPGQALYFLVRAQRSCDGPLGTRSDGTARTGRNCP